MAKIIFQMFDTQQLISLNLFLNDLNHNSALHQAYFLGGNETILGMPDKQVVSHFHLYISFWFYIKKHKNIP